jgi:hypothetical protein
MKLVFRSALFCVCLCAVTWAQAVSTSQIKGTVQDATGLAVPGAEVKVTQTETAAVRTVVTGADGGYVIPSLPVGPYSLEVTKTGFAKYVQTGIVLQVASNPEIDVSLKVGSVTEQVQVEANAALVETQSTGVGQVVDSQRVVDLPLVGRQVQDLVVISGAAVLTSTTNTNNRGTYPNIAYYSIAGGSAQGNSYSLDGAFHNDVYSNASLPLPFPDAVQEFKVETSSLPAQYGYHSGGAINAVTKSGTNEWHGTLFEFVRNYKFNGRNFFAPTQDGLKRNQWGGTVGGPIKHNKLFFFAGIQETNTRQSPTSLRTFMPTSQMLAGDFTAIASAACNAGRPIALRAPFVNNQISPALLSVPAVNITKRLDTPVDQCGTVNYGEAVKADESFGVAKVDYQFTPTHSMFWRYLGTEYDQSPPYSLGGSIRTTTSPGVADLLQSATFGDTYLFGSNIVNSFRATWNRTSNAKIAPSFFSTADVGINIFNYVPKMTSLAITGGFSTGGLTASPAQFNTAMIQIGDDIGWSKGNHQMAFGASLLGFQSNSNGNAYASGLFTITGTETGLGLADFMVGKVASLTQAAPNKLYVQQFYFGLYAQDSWKVRPGLTVSYGVRWEPYFPQQYPQNIMSHFDLGEFLKGTKTKIFLNAPPGLFYPGDPENLFGPNGSSGMKNQWKDFAPRVGLVWDPFKDGKTVIRAGYGIFFDQNTVELNLATGQGPPWGGKVNPISPPGGLANPYQGLPGGNPFPFVLSPNVPYSPYGTYDNFKIDTRLPYAQQWNLSLQRQIGNDWLLSAAYIGNEVVHLYGAIERNPAIYMGLGPCTVNGVAYNPCSTTQNTNARRLLTLLNPTEGSKVGFMDEWDDGGTRNYHGLLLSAQKRLSRGFTVSGNYTWSHCIGNVTNTFLNVQNGGVGLYFADTRDGDRGACVGATSGADTRHIANLTAVAETPKFSNRVTRALASDWRGSATVNIRSGSAFTVVSGVDNALNGINSTGQYANQVLPDIYGDKSTANLTGVRLPGQPPAQGQWLNPAAFAAPAPGTKGNTRPGIAFGPGNLTFNAGLSRLFPITERQRIELRGEAQNVLNHTNFIIPSGTLNANTFGRLQAAYDGRIMQFAFKYIF